VAAEDGLERGFVLLAEEALQQLLVGGGFSFPDRPRAGE
jgi:hypothetical protein